LLSQTGTPMAECGFDVQRATNFVIWNCIGPTRHPLVILLWLARMAVPEEMWQAALTDRGEG
jgi:hypothetical protein